MKVVAFLQNAWSTFYSGDIWPRSLWLEALWRSRSGQRLRVFTEKCPDIEFYWENTTPICGATPDSIVPPDFKHIKKVLKRERPHIVLTFGRQAEKALSVVNTDIPLFTLPHPASRRLCNAVYEDAVKVLNGWRKPILELGLTNRLDVNFRSR